MSRQEKPIFGAFCVSLSRAIEMLSPLVEDEEELKEFLISQKVWPTAVIEIESKSSPATWPEGEEVKWYVEKAEIKNLARIFSRK
jgi:hypothetical protein